MAVEFTKIVLPEAPEILRNEITRKIVRGSQLIEITKVKYKGTSSYYETFNVLLIDDGLYGKLRWEPSDPKIRSSYLTSSNILNFIQNDIYLRKEVVRSLIESGELI